MNSYILSQIGNTDEMLVYFHVLSYYGVDDFRAQWMDITIVLAVLPDLFYFNLCTVHLLLYVRGTTQNFREFARNNMNTYFKS